MISKYNDSIWAWTFQSNKIPNSISLAQMSPDNTNCFNVPSSSSFIFIVTITIFCLLLLLLRWADGGRQVKTSPGHGLRFLHGYFNLGCHHVDHTLTHINHLDREDGVEQRNALAAGSRIWENGMTKLSTLCSSKSTCSVSSRDANMLSNTFSTTSMVNGILNGISNILTFNIVIGLNNTLLNWIK